MPSSKKKQLLPKPSKFMSLTKFGYKTSKKQRSRHTSLKKASKRYGKLSVLRHINLIRNLQKNNKPIHKTMSSDVKFMSRYYKEK
jgi:hypothetical protein